MLQSTHANVDFKVNLKRIHKTLFVLSFEKCVYSSTSDVFSIMLVISKKGGGGPPKINLSSYSRFYQLSI